MAEDDRKLPGPGFIPGELHTDPSLAPQVPAGAARPFAPGEYNKNPNGSWSSEESMTSEHPSQPGRWTNVPSLWLKGGKAYVAHDEDEASDLAKQSGLNWPAYPSEDSANAAAENREGMLQGIDPDKSSSVPPLWRTDTMREGGAAYSMPVANSLTDSM